MADVTPRQQTAAQAQTMAATDSTVEPVVALYAALSAGLLADYARTVAQLTDVTPAALLAFRQRLATLTRAHLNIVAAALGPRLTHLFRTAHADGIEQATANYRGGGGSGKPNALAGIMSPTWRTHAERSVEVIRASLVDDLRIVHANVLRAPDDVYRDVVARVAQHAAADDGTTIQQAIGEGWAEFTGRGITGMTDRAGRRWPIDTYTDMAVRTAAIRAYNESYQAQLKSLGVQLFTVPDDGHPCPLCWPWQNRVLSELPDDRPWIKGTVADARAAGLFHPNCRHVLLPYFEDVTMLAQPKPWGDEQQQAYEATQRLRALERRVRMQATQYAHATDPVVRQRLKANLQRTRAAIREHVAANDLVRRPHRERATP